VEFNPAQVAAYRLIGYEKRRLEARDFNNDQKDAGDMGAGHTVTALYEIVPAKLRYPNGRPAVDALKYAQPATEPAQDATPGTTSGEVMTVKVRYKLPEADTSALLEVPVADPGKSLEQQGPDFQFAAGVAGFGMLLRASPSAKDLSWETVRTLATRGKGEDPLGYRGEFIQLIEKARGVSERKR
jgi:secreted protein with Ig-like and vWFA domain